jgi:hypothetical protein
MPVLVLYGHELVGQAAAEAIAVGCSATFGVREFRAG